MDINSREHISSEHYLWNKVRSKWKQEAKNHADVVTLDPVDKANLEAGKTEKLTSETAGDIFSSKTAQYDLKKGTVQDGLKSETAGDKGLRSTYVDSPPMRRQNFRTLSSVTASPSYYPGKAQKRETILFPQADISCFSSSALDYLNRRKPSSPSAIPGINQDQSLFEDLNKPMNIQKPAVDKNSRMFQDIFHNIVDTSTNLIGLL